MKRILGENSENLIGRKFEEVFKRNMDNFTYENGDGVKILRGELQQVNNGYLGCFLNVSDLERYKDLFDKVPAGMYRIDENNRIIMANDRFAGIFGYV